MRDAPTHFFSPSPPRDRFVARLLPIRLYLPDHLRRHVEAKAQQILLDLVVLHVLVADVLVIEFDMPLCVHARILRM